MVAVVSIKPVGLLLLLIASLSVAIITEATVHNSDLCKPVKKCINRLDQGKKCRILPIPQEAIAPVVVPGTFKLTKLRVGVWLYNDGVYLTLILYRHGQLVMLDVPDSSTSNKPNDSGTRLTDAAEQVMGSEVPSKVDIIHSHEHYDHIGKSAAFQRFMKKKYPGVEFNIWGTIATKQMIENSSVKKAPIPNMLVGNDGRVLSLGSGLKIVMNIVGGHSVQDLVMYIPPSNGEPGIVMYIDVVFPKWVPPVDLAVTEDVGRFVAAQKEILKLDFDIIVGGHFMTGDKLDVIKNVEYTEDLIDAAKQALGAVGEKEFEEAGIGRFSNPSAREFGNQWFLILGVTRKVQADFCYRIMLEKWGCRLAGIDFVGHGHCFTAITYLITDY